MGKTALILGATGLTGKLLLNRLLADEAYTCVKVFSRKPLGLQHSKLEIFIGDLLKLAHFESDFKGDELFCCIGTTANKTKDKDTYKQIDFGIPVSAAKLCKKHGIESFLVVSALGANADSRVFYNRTKGEMEQAVLMQHIPNTYILRPSLIKGFREEQRLGEAIGAIVMRIAQVFLIGKYKKYRAIEADTIAKAMHRLAQSKPKLKIIESDKIEELGSFL
ncbi:NAD-dependent epimerase/dehydratase family protein [Ancylomarina euxinus]|uniref:NAD-dependent epimerase/dehydratase family protein n=1 Tax=Ancylomarina euxinus TaxID=2283627 RepID=A0A425Y2I2_9BACT|nr:NAD(P)H-binding protein [Ancylomarina euxinus]MCZ4694995.1 NAD(P)H-binding protein [Ancylomarina euxinus]MUP14860.1 NAD(P)H-binding protein [Ancylomarina euxinus]RRG22203.1 NAD-dependent epimerase/dehydratase family protein [Ancylomarina euxinus]